jgi:hypothetical protein
MVLKFSLAAFGVSGALLAFSTTAHAQCDPQVCGNPNRPAPEYYCYPTNCSNPRAYRNLGAAGPRIFSTPRAAKTFCPSEAIVWRTAHGRVYGAKAKGYGVIKPGFYMCRSHSDTVTRIDAEGAAKPR